MSIEACPCSSQKPFAECCQPNLEGKAVPPTAEALMRSRYTAYTRQNIDYLHDTLAPEARSDFDRASATEWAKRATWKKLEIHATEKGQPGDTEGTVEFTAHFVMDGKPIAHKEKSLFRNEGGRWYFVDEIKEKSKPVVKPPEPGRNDPCPCGSGKKYKKCHALAA